MNPVLMMTNGGYHPNLAMPNSVVVLLAACLIVFSTSASAVTPHSSWRNSLKPSGPLGPELPIANDARARVRILIPADPSTQERKAAEDLASWLAEITGARFRVSREGSASVSSGPVISVGRTRLLADSGLAGSRADLGDEGYSVGSKDGNLFLAGGATRGIINAVYAFLEEDLGCRWYSRNSSTIPKRPRLTVRPVSRSYVPGFEIRDPYYFEAFDGAWSLRNRTNSSMAAVPNEWGGNKHYALFVHTFNTLAPADKYFKDHPEYYSEIDGKRNPGQLCFSNPDVLKITIESVRRVLRESPESQIISVSQNDSWPCCACKECKAAADAEGSIAGPLLMFVNSVAEQIEKEFPRVRISTLAYLDTSMPPKTVRPRSNVAIQLCTDSHAWGEPFLRIEQTQVFSARMKAWAEMGAALHIWDYTCNFSHYAGPMPNWQVVTDSIRYFARYKAKGVMLQGNYQTPGTSDGNMRCWVWAKQLWDPSLDTRELIRDFVFGYYGKAAPAIWQYEDLLWNTWEREHAGKLKSTEGGIRYPMSLFGKDFMDEAKRCFDKALAADEDQDTRARVEEAKLQVLYAEVSQGMQTGTPEDRASYARALADFERIARQMKMTHIQEGAPDFEPWLEKAKQVHASNN